MVLVSNVWNESLVILPLTAIGVNINAKFYMSEVSIDVLRTLINLFITLPWFKATTK